MSKISLKPFTLDKNTWCYEEEEGLIIMHEDRTLEGKFITTRRIKISLKKIKGYLKRGNK